MSGAEVNVSVNLKAVINKQKTRVLFAEFDNDFANVLLSFLFLSLGNIMRFMEMRYGNKTPQLNGSLNSLYNALQYIDTFQIGLYEEADFMIYRIFTGNKVSFIIGDDLKIAPNVNESIVQTLNSVGVDMSEIDGAETRNVTFGLNEIMDFLKGLLVSRQPLTDIILGGIEEKSETGLSHRFEKKTNFNSIKKYNLKVMIQKSTKKLLFAQAEKDFVSFLSTILTTPLGKIDLHLGGNSYLDKIHNLYRSLCELFDLYINDIDPNDISDLVDHKYSNNKDSKDRLMKLETFPIFQNLVDNLHEWKLYKVKDDLSITHLCLSSTISFLNEMKISSSDVEEVDLHIGMEEARNILKASLTSTSALSDALFNPV